MCLFKTHFVQLWSGNLCLKHSIDFLLTLETRVLLVTICMTGIEHHSWPDSYPQGSWILFLGWCECTLFMPELKRGRCVQWASHIAWRCSVHPFPLSPMELLYNCHTKSARHFLKQSPWSSASNWLISFACWTNNFCFDFEKATPLILMLSWRKSFQVMHSPVGVLFLTTMKTLLARPNTGLLPTDVPLYCQFLTHLTHTNALSLVPKPLILSSF